MPQPYDSDYLHVAAWNNDPQMLEACLACDADAVNAKDGRGWVPLQYAVCHGLLRNVKVLLAHHAEVTSGVLDLAAGQGDLEMLKELFRHGFNPILKQTSYQSNRRTLACALRRGRTNVVHFLLDEGFRATAREVHMLVFPFSTYDAEILLPRLLAAGGRMDETFGGREFLWYLTRTPSAACLMHKAFSLGYQPRDWRLALYHALWCYSFALLDLLSDAPGFDLNVVIRQDVRGATLLYRCLGTKLALLLPVLLRRGLILYPSECAYLVSKAADNSGIMAEILVATNLHKAAIDAVLASPTVPPHHPLARALTKASDAERRQCLNRERAYLRPQKIK